MRSLIIISILLIVLPAIGTLGFYWIEGWSLLDSLYMAIITLSTVGYEIPQSLSDMGKLFIIFYITASLSIVFYSLTKIGELAVGGELKLMLRSRIMHQKIKGLNNHYVICGVGRMGSAICSQLEKADQDFVIIEASSERIDLARQKGWHCIEGDATSDEVLKNAKLDKAKCIACVLPNDTDNLFTVMSARLLNNQVNIIARANEESTINKLKRAGANRIVNPYSTGAVKISQLMINPQLEEFIEILGDQDLGIDLTIMHVDRKSRLLGRTLAELNLDKTGVLVIGIKKQAGQLLLPPPLDSVLELNDSLVTVGKTKALQKTFDIKS